MASNLQQLRSHAYRIGMFWMAISYVFLAITLGLTFVADPALLLRPRGWAIVALSGLFAGWYAWGQRWVQGGDGDAYWSARIRGLQRGFPLRAVLYWLGLVATALALVALDSHFNTMLWVVYGVSLALVNLPWGLALLVPTGGIIFAANGWLPTEADPRSLLLTAASVTGFTIYSALGYLPFLLLRQRFQREHLFAQLEQSHRDLAEAHQQLSRAAEHDRELAVLRERARLARDLHDTLGQALALTAVKLEAAQRLRAVNAARADEEIAQTQALARTALADLRRALADLRSPAATQLPLGEVLAAHARAIAERAGWQVTCDLCPEATLREQPAAYEALLRVGTEALTNIERHARAHEVTLSLARVGDEIVLRVSDDGVGILTTNPPVQALGGTAQRGLAPAAISSPPGHYGISGMRERVRDLAGTFRIGPLGEGTRGTLVEARLPVTG